MEGSHENMVRSTFPYSPEGRWQHVESDNVDKHVFLEISFDKLSIEISRQKPR